METNVGPLLALGPSVIPLAVRHMTEQGACGKSQQAGGILRDASGVIPEATAMSLMAPRARLSLPQGKPLFAA